ncbi:hypothetical protein EVAR_99480_1 [Eumeta japonica]|uniref:Uncharacterized protein n=1 Tax=Eumeta variegata TaxID=151549 RepID=A0A4C1ZW02_EUMVA|nr:hypothetical protein EVAR_99480_1 [Eumeta japonica]
MYALCAEDPEFEPKHAESWLVHSLMTYFRRSRQVSEVIDVVFNYAALITACIAYRLTLIASRNALQFREFRAMCPTRRRGVAAAAADADGNAVPDVIMAAAQRAEARAQTRAQIQAQIEAQAIDEYGAGAGTAAGATAGTGGGAASLRPCR